MASLIVASGPRSGESFWLGDHVNIIGSGQWASMRIIDRGVSREHLTIHLDLGTGYCVVSPMDPNNPVYVNGRQIASDRRLFEEDRILIGNTVLVFTEKDLGGHRAATEPCGAGVDQGPVAEDGPALEEGGLIEICGWRMVWDEAGMTFMRFTESSHFTPALSAKPGVGLGSVLGPRGVPAALAS